MKEKEQKLILDGLSELAECHFRMLQVMMNLKTGLEQSFNAPPPYAAPAKNKTQKNKGRTRR